MNELISKKRNSQRRTHRVRARVLDRPRLSIHISTHNVTAQIIDDSAGKTLAYATTVGNKKITGTLTAKAEYVGKLIAQKAKKIKIRKVAFDRGDRLYHGRIKALAEAARGEGLEF